MISPHCKQMLDNFEDFSKRKDICWDFREIRSVVLCKAWELMEKNHLPFKVAVQEAWSWAKEKCKDVGAYI